MSEEALLQEAGDEKDPVLVRAANAIWDGNLTALGLELDEHGDLVIDSDELMKSEVVDISHPEGEEEEKAAKKESRVNGETGSAARVKEKAKVLEKGTKENASIADASAIKHGSARPDKQTWYKKRLMTTLEMTTKSTRTTWTSGRCGTSAQ